MASSLPSLISTHLKNCEWLLGCEYHNDPDYSSDRKPWPSPSDFEGCRRGDCKGHALWAWRKLNELGIVAELVCGQPRWDKEEFQPFSTTDVFFQGHAWVQFNRNGVEYLFDPSLKDRVCMVRPLTDVRAWYQPWFAVGPDFRRYMYWGHAVFLFA
jgi:hypothetical protein